ncbi:MAG: hypothetical protein QOE29_1331, partial [Gaiellaceae bacterium]|nr:hypothetical protein [Gaiellaceae bacterium]
MSTSYQIGLFLHIAFLLVGFSAGTMMVVTASKLRSATTGAESFPWGMLAAKTARAFPIAVVGLFLTGAYMTHKVSWSWSSGWIVAGIIGLAILMGQGALIEGRHGKELGAALRANGPGPLSDEIRAMTSSRLHWVVTLGAEGLVLAIIWNMLHKPGLLAAHVNMVVGYGAFAAIGLWVAAKKL